MNNRNYKTIDQLLSENPNLLLAVGFLIESIKISSSCPDHVLSNWDKIRREDQKNKEKYD